MKLGNLIILIIFILSSLMSIFIYLRYNLSITFIFLLYCIGALLISLVFSKKEVYHIYKFNLKLSLIITIWIFFVIIVFLINFIWNYWGMKMDFNNFKRILFSKKEDLSTIDRFKRFKYDYYLIICGLFIISTIIGFYLSKNIISIIV